MNKKIMTIGIISMFLLTSLSVGTTLGEKITQEASTSENDLVVELITRTSWSNPIGTCVKITNAGTETIYGPITVTLTIKKGFFGFIKFDEQTFTLASEGSYISPGDMKWVGDWEPDPSVAPGGIFNFQYKVNINDDNTGNNIDCQKYLIIHYRMFWFGRH